MRGGQGYSIVPTPRSCWNLATVSNSGPETTMDCGVHEAQGYHEWGQHLGQGRPRDPERLQCREYRPVECGVDDKTDHSDLGSGLGGQGEHSRDPGLAGGVDWDIWR